MSDSPAQKFRSELSQVADTLGLDENTGLFPLDSDWRRLSMSYSTVLGAPRALLLQVAHPIIAQGVYDHSEFDTNPAKRAVRTFLGVWAVALGSQTTAIDVATIVFRAHLTIRGTIPSYSPTMGDRKYSAMNPEANLWVWATLVEGVLFGHREVGNEIPRERLERMYEESKTFGAFFHVRPDLIPETLDDFERYFDHVVANDLEITPAAKEVSEALLSGARFPFTLAGWLIRTGVVETLPASVTAAFGWKRTRFTRSLYAGLRGALRAPYAVLPEVLTTMPLAFLPNLRRTFLGTGVKKASARRAIERDSRVQPHA